MRQLRTVYEGPHGGLVISPELLAGLERIVNQGLETRLGPLTRQVQGLEVDAATTSRLLGAVARSLRIGPDGGGIGEADEDSEPPVQNDVVWQCEKCGQRIGFYSNESDVIRIRHKDHIAYSHLGVGGWLRVICRGCSHINTLNYEAAADTPAIPVIDGLAILDVALLEQLLERAHGTAEGAVTIRVGSGSPG